MSKILKGKVIKAKMEKTVVVAVESRRPHPIYRKLIRRTTKIKADKGEMELTEGDIVRVQEVRPISRGKHFKVIEVIKKEPKK